MEGGKMMPTKDRPLTKASIQTAAPMRFAEMPAEDDSRSEVSPKVVRIRDSQGYLSASLTSEIEKTWGSFQAIKTRTDVEKNLIYILKADPADPTSTPVNRYGTMNAAVFSLFVPLQKLGLRPKPDRQWEVVPYEQPFEDGSSAFALPMLERVSLKRGKNDESAPVTDVAKPSSKAKRAAETQATLDDLDDEDDEA
jgi:hypothetical protein